ncbi:MAG: SpoIIE family protein phosphatase [Negativicutes bacterium]|nr:SpoIIE family protein phosphatase [Negativicutes bacterium]MDR3591937.1 SpoIIE family protein phosphatase [Negativicutes bacterium]
MGTLHAEVAVAQLSKAGEELCGDKVEVTRAEDKTTVVLSDGLGSGVKANILATLTTKIASSMLKRRIPLEEVVNTISQTLPVCRERKIAYSTFHIVKLRPDGETTVVEYDSPASFLLRGGQVVPFPTHEKVIAGKTVNEGYLVLQENDFLVAVSDGVIHSGIGGLLKLGWNWQGIASELAAYSAECSARDVAQGILNCCNGYYLGQPGDDSTVVVIKLRRPRQLTLLTGPPSDVSLDEKVVRRFMLAPGMKVVAGGTTANLVGRITGNSVAVDLSYHDPEVPPTARIEGVDLVTEGVLTLTAAIDRFDNHRRLNDPSFRDGATLLARLMLEADKINILAGTAVNPAHQNPNFPARISIKNQVLERLRGKLESIGKQVKLEWF